MKKVEAIELGKIWMRNSVNKGHDYEHASNVEKHGLEIYRELKKVDPGVDFDEGVVSLVAWWHDAYKSRIASPSIWAFFFEGRECERIVRKELADYVVKKELDIICNAIFNHNNFLAYFLLPNSYGPLVQILIEADNIEVFNKDRLMRSYRESDNVIFQLIIKAYLYNLKFWLTLLPKSKYMYNFLSKLDFKNIK